MEGSVSEAIFESLNLNPQLFIDAALNIVDELIDSAFDHLHQEASTQLKVNGSDRAEDLTKAEQESAELKREIQALERQSAINNHQANTISELTMLSEQISENDAFQELQKLATELRTKVENLKTEREDETQHARFEKLQSWNEDLLKLIGGNGLSSARPEETEGFLAGFEHSLNCQPVIAISTSFMY